VQWLEAKLENTDWNTALDNFHIIGLANVIQIVIQKDASIDTTIDEIRNIINNKKAEDAWKKEMNNKKTLGKIQGFFIVHLWCSMYIPTIMINLVIKDTTSYF
jgi:hypothetical protein